MSDGENDQIQAVVDTGCVPRLVELLSGASIAVQVPALRALGEEKNGLTVGLSA